MQILRKRLFSTHYNFVTFHNTEVVFEKKVFSPCSELFQITSLGLRSLKIVAHGNIYIKHLENLCYADTIAWRKIIKDPIPNQRIFPYGARVRVGKNCELLVRFGYLSETF